MPLLNQLLKTWALKSRCRLLPFCPPYKDKKKRLLIVKGLCRFLKTYAAPYQSEDSIFYSGNWRYTLKRTRREKSKKKKDSRSNEKFCVNRILRREETRNRHRTPGRIRDPHLHILGSLVPPLSPWSSLISPAVPSSLYRSTRSFRHSLS